MNVKGLINRRLVMMVAAPVARAVLSALVGYLGSKGVPADQIEQFAAALGAFCVVAFNISWELIDRKKAETKAARNILTEITDALPPQTLLYEKPSGGFHIRQVVL